MAASEDLCLEAPHLRRNRSEPLLVVQRFCGTSVGPVARLDHTISSIKASPYVRAVDEKVTIAFVPYENRGTVKPGAPLYACAIGPLFCHRVGSVGDVLPGETPVRHPLHNTTPRGLMVQVRLADSRAVEHKVLFAGGSRCSSSVGQHPRMARASDMRAP